MVLLIHTHKTVVKINQQQLFELHTRTGLCNGKFF